MHYSHIARAAEAQRRRTEDDGKKRFGTTGIGKRELARRAGIPEATVRRLILYPSLKVKQLFQLWEALGFNVEIVCSPGPEMKGQPEYRFTSRGTKAVDAR